MSAPIIPNTAPARRAKKQKARAAAEATGTLDEVRAVLWRCVSRLNVLIDDADTAVVLRASHALVQACGAYVKVLEVGEIEARLNELEARLVETPGNGFVA